MVNALALSTNPQAGPLRYSLASTRDAQRNQNSEPKLRPPAVSKSLTRSTALLRELKEVFRRHRSHPIERVISLINPMLRGWVNYFAVGNSSECFTYIRDRVEKKVRRHLAHARKRKGFGWERWSRPWLYDTLGLFNSYRVRHDGPKVAPV